MQKTPDEIPPLNFVAIGDPIPCDRYTRRARFVRPQAIDYGAWVVTARDQIANQFLASKHPGFPKWPLKLTTKFYIPASVMCSRDLVNCVKGIEDSINGTGVWPDDTYVFTYGEGTSKHIGKSGEYRVEIKIEMLSVDECVSLGYVPKVMAMGDISIVPHPALMEAKEQKALRIAMRSSSNGPLGRAKKPRSRKAR